MKQLLENVADFHYATDTPVKNKTEFPSEERRKLRRELIREEYQEFLDAEEDDNIVGVADALTDLIYVIVGCALEYGIPLHRVWYEVQRSNMAKVDPSTGKVRKRQDGKVLKPKEWTPPDIKGALGPLSPPRPEENMADGPEPDHEAALRVATSVHPCDWSTDECDLVRRCYLEMLAKRDKGWRRCRKLPVVVEARPAVPGEKIATREGELIAQSGDLIIRGVEGELYPIGREIFDKTYEWVD